MPAFIVKGNKFWDFQYPKNDNESAQIKIMSYASIIENMMYAQVCTRPDLAFITGMLGSYQPNPEMDHWKATKKALCYLQGT